MPDIIVLSVCIYLLHNGNNLVTFNASLVIFIKVLVYVNYYELSRS